MAKNRKQQAKDLIGLSIYHDPKLGTIFYDVLSKRAFQLINQDVRYYNIYSALLPLCAFLAYLGYLLFHMTFIPCLLLFVAFWIISEIAARYMFFYKLPEAKNWKKFKKDNIFVAMAKNYTHLRLMLLALLLVLIAVVMVANARMEGFEGANLYGSYIIAAGAALFAVLALIALAVKYAKKL